MQWKLQTHTIGIILFNTKKRNIFVFNKILSCTYRTNYNILGKYRTFTEPFQKTLYRTMFCIQNRMAALYVYTNIQCPQYGIIFITNVLLTWLFLHFRLDIGLFPGNQNSFLVTTSYSNLIGFLEVKCRYHPSRIL